MKYDDLESGIVQSGDQYQNTGYEDAPWRNAESSIGSDVSKFKGLIFRRPTEPMFATVADIPDDLRWLGRHFNSWSDSRFKLAYKTKDDYGNDIVMRSTDRGYSKEQWQEARRMVEDHLCLKQNIGKPSEPEEWTSRIPAGSTHHSVDGGENDIFIKLDDGIFKMWRHDHWANVFGAFPFDLELVPQPTGAELLAEEREKIISEMYNVVKAKAGEEFTMSEAYGILYDEKYRLTEPK